MIVFLPKIILLLLVSSSYVAAQSNDLSLAISAINQARQGQGAQPLAWNDELASYAALWAQQIATGTVAFGHSSGEYRPSQGETLYEEQSSTCDQAYDNPIQVATNSWLAESSQWNGQPVSTGTESWLHWSQIMWSDTTHIGCAHAYSISLPYKVYSVCRFYPEGNIIGQLPF